MWSLIVTGSAIIIVYILFTIRWTAGTFIKVFVLSAILVSFFLTWWNLLKVFFIIFIEMFVTLSVFMLCVLGSGNKAHG